MQAVPVKNLTKLAFSTAQIFASLVPMSGPSLQESYAPASRCYGCGPANDSGLRIRSFVEGNLVVAEWQPSDHHQAFPGMLNGGIIGTLLDCHSNWTAAWHLMQTNGLDRPLCTVTAEYAVKFLRPTPLHETVGLRAQVVESAADRVVIAAELSSSGKLRATCRGTFVAVRPGHPAYHQW
jgi:acyl-coenzyme A thioesterase PaaI-like protein